MDREDKKLQRAIEKLERLAQQRCFEGYDGDLICESEWGYYTIKREQLKPEEE